MGSFIEFNDTLQITNAQGFPVRILNLHKHKKRPIKLEDIQGKIFAFHDKLGARIYHLPPTRCFLVQNVGGKWLYWGKILMLEQTIQEDGKRKCRTSGKYKIIQIYDPDYQEQITKNESPKRDSYF